MLLFLLFLALFALFLFFFLALFFLFLFLLFLSLFLSLALFKELLQIGFKFLMLLLYLAQIILVKFAVGFHIRDGRRALRIQFLQFLPLALLLLSALLQLFQAFLKLALFVIKLLLFGFVLLFQRYQSVDHIVVIVGYALYQLYLHEHIVKIRSAD